MKRRELLATSGLFATVPISGCLSFLEEDNEDEYPDLPSKERVSEPPYQIEIPEESSWNPNYLGQNMSYSPTVSFSKVNNASLENKKLSVKSMVEANEYLVRFIDNQSDLDKILDTNSGFSIDFSDEILIVVESGYGSSSMIHKWRRVEETEKGLSLYGFYQEPLDKRLDFKSKSSIIRAEKPDNLSNISVNLTVTEDHRVHFDSDEGIVRVEVIA